MGLLITGVDLERGTNQTRTRLPCIRLDRGLIIWNQRGLAWAILADCIVPILSTERRRIATTSISQ